jgi:hypothetical protein
MGDLSFRTTWMRPPRSPLTRIPDHGSVAAHDGRRASSRDGKAKRAEAIKKQGGKAVAILAALQIEESWRRCKRKGQQKFEPYAYVPLDGRAIQRRIGELQSIDVFSREDRRQA